MYQPNLAQSISVRTIFKVFPNNSFPPKKEIRRMLNGFGFFLKSSKNTGLISTNLGPTQH